jgi:hypothetical protein
MARTWSRRDLRWQGDQLCCGKVALLEIEEDALHPSMVLSIRPGALGSLGALKPVGSTLVLLVLSPTNSHDLPPASSAAESRAVRDASPRTNRAVARSRPR